MTDKELIARLLAVCTCNIDSTPCMAEDDCRDAIAAADRIEQLVKDKRWIMEERDRTFALMLARAEAAEAERDALISQHAVMMMERDAARFDVEAAEAQIAALTAQVERLTGVLHNCVGMLDCLVAESGRSIEWGQEDPFRMGEWFEPEDLAQIKQARAALSATTEEGHE